MLAASHVPSAGASGGGIGGRLATTRKIAPPGGCGHGFYYTGFYYVPPKTLFGPPTC